MNNNTTYKGYIIIDEGYGFTWAHEDFDGAPDANDHRCGIAFSIEEAIKEIDENIEQENERA